MSIHRFSGSLILGLAIVLSTLLPVCGAEEAPQVMPEPTAPRFELTCNASEFASLQSAASAGIVKHGGDMTLHIRVQKQGEQTNWVLSVPAANLLDAWGFWISERIADLVASANLEKMDEQTRKDLQAAKDAKAQIDACKANPIFDPYSRTGDLQQKDGSYILKDGQLEFLLTGDKAKSKPDLVGKPVALTGYMKTKGQIEVTNIAFRKKNTLDLFVMSLCPFGTRAESILINFLKSSSLPKEAQPKLEVHYVFYKKVEDGKTTYTSLHGEEEIVENLAQIVIRDKYPALFWEYLDARSVMKGTWHQVAAALGTDPKVLDTIRKEIASKRNELIEKEIAYCESYDILDGSPTYVWEGMKVQSLDQIPAFKGLNLSQQMCGK